MPQVGGPAGGRGAGAGGRDVQMHNCGVSGQLTGPTGGGRAVGGPSVPDAAPNTSAGRGARPRGAAVWALALRPLLHSARQPPPRHPPRHPHPLTTRQHASRPPDLHPPRGHTPAGAGSRRADAWCGDTRRAADAGARVGVGGGLGLGLRHEEFLERNGVAVRWAKQGMARPAAGRADVRRAATRRPHSRLPSCSLASPLLHLPPPPSYPPPPPHPPAPWPPSSARPGSSTSTLPCVWTRPASSTG